MFATLSAVFWGIVTFSILVVLHEGGHFLTARAFGVHVHEFMIGLPGPAVRFHGKKTAYGITAIPLGGYVRISGMEPGPEDPLLGPALAFVTAQRAATSFDVAEALGVEAGLAESALVTLLDWNAIDAAPDDENSYVARFPAELAQDPAALLDNARSTTYRGLSTVKRIAVLSAGVLVNLVSAILVFVLVLTLYGVPTQTLTVESTLAKGAAAAAGISPGDTVQKLNGSTLQDWAALLATLAKHKPGDVVTVTVDRGGELVTKTLTLGASESGGALLGIGVTQTRVRLSVGEALKDSFMWIGLVFKAIGGFFNPATFQTSVSQSSSVVGISVEVSRAVKNGPIDYAFIVALLSLSLGVMNILPIPPLDGGKIVLEIWEAIIGRPLSRQVAIGLSATGTLLLLTFIGYLMYSDVMKYAVHGG
ncbi:MAG: M50 family metallopeptidase [Coriobacteriia bacterium]